jgi:hypothetical protein
MHSRKTLALKLAALCAVPLLLAACGGGSDKPCSDSSTLLVGFNYLTPGVVSSGNTVGYKPGEAFSIKPSTIGIPASCDAVKHFSIAPQAVFSGPVINLPASVQLDPASGTIAGTLAVPLGRCLSGGTGYLNASNPVCDKGGTFTNAVFDVTLSLPGFSDLKRSVFFLNR